VRACDLDDVRLVDLRGNGRTRLTAGCSVLGCDEKASRKLPCVRAVDGLGRRHRSGFSLHHERGSLSADGQSYHYLVLT
jgi:hypothetical protein